MEKNQQKSEQEDFTSKGRTSNEGRQDAAANLRQPTDISEVDRQEGEMNNGTTGADHHLFTQHDRPDQ